MFGEKLFGGLNVEMIASNDPDESMEKFGFASGVCWGSWLHPVAWPNV